MFTKPRPVPSPAALKALYQLAYISTGTVVGAATLCAEERRRRTKIVQKIADNARAIRQSPRYNHSAALAAGASDGPGLAFWGGGESPASGLKRRKRRRNDLDGNDDEAIRGAELPSMVEREYVATHGSGERRVSRGPAARKDQRNAATQVGPSFSTIVAPVITPRTPRASASCKGQQCDSDNEGRGSQDPGTRPESYIYRTYRRDSGESLSSLQRSDTDRSAANPSTDIGAGTKESADGRPYFPHTFTVQLVYPDASAVSSSHITSDVDGFLESRTDAPLTRDESSSARHNIDDLLERALIRGSLNDIRSLYLWKLRHGTFRDVDAIDVCSRCTALAGRLDLVELLEFYVNLFLSHSFRQLESTTRLEQGLRVLADTLEWETHSTLDTERQDLTNALLIDVRGSQQLIFALSSEIKRLLTRHRVAQAVDMLFLIGSRRGEYKPFNSIADEIFASALADGSLSQCAKVLRWKRCYMSLWSMQEQCEAFIEACSDQKAYDQLVGLVFDNSSGSSAFSALAAPSSRLHSRSRAVLAVACSTREQLSMEFKALYRGLDKEVRNTLQVDAFPSVLRITWESTRSLGQVRTQYETLKGTLKEDGRADLMRYLDLVLLDILTSANRVDEALVTMARMKKVQGARSDPIVRAALHFAHSHAWEALSCVLDKAETASFSRLTRPQERQFNMAIFYYSKVHSAQDTWTFVTTAIDKLGFRPNRTTFHFVMDCFVSNKAVRLIPAWFRYLRVRGHRFGFDDKAAARLLTRHYLTHRPSHVLVMWCCTNLSHHAPSLVSGGLVDLVKQAIGYDLRKLSGPNAQALAEHARMRFERLEVFGLKAFSPGHRHDRQLYFTESKDVVQDTGLARPGTAAANLSPIHPQQEVGAGVESLEDQDQASVSATSAERFGHTETSPTEAAILPPCPTRQPNDMSSSDDTDADARFFDLRPDYIEEQTDIHGNITHTNKAPQLEKDMVTALSFAQYRKALRIYYGSMDAVGLPATIRTLEIAVEASLRLHNGESFDAERILSKARTAGMNVTCAIGPLLIRRIQTFNPRLRQGANDIRMTTMEYYRMNDENGWQVQHHVGITAANKLIANERPEYGLNLLTAIYQSEWAKNRPLDIVAMTVFLKGYVAIQSLAGMKWVVQTVLSMKLRIDGEFLAVLKQVTRGVVFLAKGVEYRLDRVDRRTRTRVFSWLELCRERRTQQRREIKVLGKKLVKCIVRCAQDEATVDLDQRETLDMELFGDARTDKAVADPGKTSAAQETARRLGLRVNPHRARRLRLMQGTRKTDTEWLKSYRFFLRKPMVTADGRLASFRFSATCARRPKRSIPR